MKNLFKTLLAVSFLLLTTTITTHATGNAKVQVIHNCADPAADTVDVYVNGTIAVPGFAFRTATQFIPVPSGLALSIAIAPKHSTSVAQAIATFSEGPLATDSNYIIIASGVVGNGFAANPNSISTSFTLKVIPSAQTTASDPGNVDFAIFHGATDAPSVDVRLSGGGPTLASGLEYLDSTGYIAVPANWYPVSIFQHDSTKPLANYLADLSGLKGGAGVVLASGFLNPAANNNGPAFGLWLALASGGNLIQLPLQTNANVQIIHNSPDPAADSVDIYVDGNKAVPSFKFRTATPFIPLLAGVNHTIAVAPAPSTSVAQAVATFDSINLTANQNYVVTATGLVGSGFAANPNGRSTAFKLLIKTPAETHAATAGDFDFFVIHGSPDAPGVNVQVQGGPTIITDAKYTDQTPYIPVPAANYVLNLQDSAGAPLVSYVANLTGLVDSSSAILASGFLNPANNKNGPAFGLFVALPSGGPLIPLSVSTGIDELQKQIGLAIYPNPTNGKVVMNFQLPKSENIAVQLLDLNGNLLENLKEGEFSGRQTLNFDLAKYNSGLYFIRVATPTQVSNQKITIIK